MPPSEQVVDESLVVVQDSQKHEGKGLFARCDIGFDKSIASVLHPLTEALDTDRLNDTCYYCLRSPTSLISGSDPTGMLAPETMKRCSGCKVVKYCNENHGKLGWKAYHSKECAQFASIYPNLIPGPGRAVIRLLLKRKHNRISEEDWSHFSTLPSHLDRFEASQNKRRWEDLNLMAMACQKHSNTSLPFQAVLGVCARLLINSFTLQTPTNDPIGSWAHPLFARANHSCDYNATISFNTPSSTKLVPVREIQKGEEILLPYIDSTQTFEYRQHELKSTYFFTCHCNICAQGPSTFRDEFLTSSKKIETNTIRDVESRARNLMESAKDEDPPDALGKLKNALQLLARTGAWPLTRQPYPEIRQHLVQASIHAGDFVGALVQATIQHFRIDLTLYSERNPTYIIHTWILCRLIETVSLGSGPFSTTVDEYLEKFGVSKFALGSISVDLLDKLNHIIGRGDNGGGFSELYQAIKRKYAEVSGQAEGGFERWRKDHETQIRKDRAAFEQMMSHALEQERQGSLP